MKVITYSLFILLLLNVSPAAVSEEDATKDQTEPSPSDSLLAIPLEEKVGQLFLIGFKGTDFDSSLKERVEKIKPGGLIFFKRNIANTSRVSNMIYEIQKFNFDRQRIPVFTAIDQEGGVVTRIRTNPPMPSALAMGRASNPKLINSIGLATGKKLKAIGFNLNLAPVLDLSDPKKFSFIGNRSFGNNPTAAAAAAIQFSKGVEAAGVLSTAKHFPGHGNVDTDSHVELPISKITKDILMDSNVLPYRRSIDEKAISAVMMAHMSFPNIDEAYPATYSKKIIDILKSDLNFSGILLTDDIQMTGANIYPSIAERAVQAFLAGNDMIMVAWSYPDQLDAYNGILEAVKSGRIQESRVDESFRKIHNLKERFKILNKPDVPSKLVRSLAEEKDPALHANINAMFQDILEQEQKKIELKIRDLPDQALVIVSSEDSFLNDFRKAKISRKTIAIKLRKNTSFKNLELFEKRGRSFVGIAHVSGPITAKIINRMPLSVRNNFVLVNNYFPGAVNNLESFQTVIDIPLRNEAMGKSIAGWFRDHHRRNITPDREAASLE